jgi:hypothetical protein
MFSFTFTVLFLVSGSLSSKSFLKIASSVAGFSAVIDRYDFVGRALASLADVNGDAVPDLAVGTGGYDFQSSYNGDDDGGLDRGALYVLFLQSSCQAASMVLSFQKLSSTRGEFTARLDNSDFFGSAVAGLTDLNLDGTSDVVSGAFGDDDGGTGRGAIYVVFLSSAGTVRSFQKVSASSGAFTAALGDFDAFGAAVAGLGDANGDYILDIAVGAMWDDNGGTDRGAIYILFMMTNGVVKSSQTLSQLTGMFTGLLDDQDFFGSSVSVLADVNRDAHAELVAGSIGDDDGGTGRGAVYILFISTVGVSTSLQKISSTLGSFTAALYNSDAFGSSVCGLSDLNGDFQADLAVGALLRDDGGLNRGCVYVLFLQSSGAVRYFSKLSSTVGGLTASLLNSDYFGSAIAGGLSDLNGDSFPDWVVGSFGRDEPAGNSDTGAIYLLFSGYLAFSVIVCRFPVLDIILFVYV